MSKDCHPRKFQIEHRHIAQHIVGVEHSLRTLANEVEKTNPEHGGGGREHRTQV